MSDRERGRQMAADFAMILGVVYVIGALALLLCVMEGVHE